MTRTSIAVLFLLLLSPFAHADAPPSAPAGDELPRFVLVLEPGAGEAPDLGVYGATKLDQWYDRIFIRISDEQARELSKHPRVRYVQRLLEAGERNTFVPATEHERGPGRAVTADAITAPAWSSGNYSYDGAGNVIGIGSDTYVYDAVGRLKRATLTGTSTYETYTYDAFGNLNQRNRTSGSTTTPYASPASGTNNRLSGAAYDTTGNFVSGSGSLYGYEWDSFRMIARQTGSGRNDYYVYDANDERIGSLSVPAGSWKWTIRDVGGQVLREYESQNVAGADWIWAEDFVYDGRGAVGSEREQAEGGRRHFHRDHLGSVRMVTNHAGQAISRHDYAPFGHEVTALNQEADRGYSRPTTKAFTGHERDYNSGTATPNTDYLDYMHARYYSPNWGRFLSVDPGPYDPGRPQQWNRYSYALNNPSTLVDPDGRQVVDPRQAVRTFLILYSVAKTAKNESSRIKGPNMSGSVISNLKSAGVKGWNYVSFGLSDALDGKEVFAITAQMNGLGASVSLDFSSLDKSNFSLLGLVFQKTLFGEEPDKISLGAGKIIGAEIDIPIQPLMVELVESASADDLTLVMNSLEKHPELAAGYHFIEGILVRVGGK